MHIARGFEELGHTVLYRGRGEPIGDADLCVQVGFNASIALTDALEKRRPYLIMEAGPFRKWTKQTDHISWGYNGLAGGAFRGEPGDEPRWHPEPELERTEGGILVMGQKPMDHSLRGSDHVGWLEAKLREYPEATYRPHPLMVHGQSGIEDALEGIQKVIVYTSTSAVEAAIAGCEVVVEGQGCWWDPSMEMDRQLHALSWAAFSPNEYHGPAAAHTLRSYEEARAKAEAGQVEIPRRKLDGRSLCERHDNSWIQGRTAGAPQGE
jgi:hypothetical protein